MSHAIRFRSIAPVVVALAVSALPAVAQQYSMEGVYIDTCSCAAPCACALTGLERGCQGVGAEAITSGSFQGQDLSGAKIAYAVIPAGEKMRLYIDAKNPEQRKAAEAFARAALAPMGKVDAVKDAKIDIQGENGNYTVKVDDGKIMTFKTEPVLGGDKKTPIAHTNTQDPVISTFYQGKNVSTTYHDGDQSFTLSGGTNAYFNDHVKASGNLSETTPADQNKRS